MRIEKKKESRIILVAMMVALIVLMTGCIQMEVGVEINQDGTGKFEVMLAQNTDLTEEELDTEMGALTLFDEEDFEGLEGVSVRTEVVEYLDK